LMLLLNKEDIDPALFAEVKRRLHENGYADTELTDLDIVMGFSASAAFEKWIKAEEPQPTAAPYSHDAAQGRKDYIIHFLQRARDQGTTDQKIFLRDFLEALIEDDSVHYLFRQTIAAGPQQQDRAQLLQGFDFTPYITALETGNDPIPVYLKLLNVTATRSSFLMYQQYIGRLDFSWDEDASLLYKNAFPDTGNNPICNTIEIKPSGTALLQPYYEFTPNYNAYQDSAYGTTGAHVTTFTLTLTPKAPNMADLLDTKVRAALQQLKNIEPEFPPPPGSHTQPYQRAYLPVRKNPDGTVTIESPLTFEDVLFFYRLSRDYIEPCSQIAQALHHANRHLKQQGPLLEKESHTHGLAATGDYGMHGRDPNSRLGNLCDAPDDMLLDAAKRHLALMRGLGLVDDQTALAQATSIAAATLEGRILDPSGTYVPYNPQLAPPQTASTELTHYEATLAGRTLDILADIAETGTVVPGADPSLKARFQAAAKEAAAIDGREMALQEVVAICSGFAEDDRQSKKLGVHNSARQKRTPKAPKPDTDLLPARRSTGLSIDHKIPPIVDRPYNGTTYISHAAGSLLNPTRLPADLAKFLEPQSGPDRRQQLLLSIQTKMEQGPKA
jgi:hypothetical protein